MNEYLNNLVTEYSKLINILNGETITQIGSNIYWKEWSYADDIESDIIISNLIYLDIKSCGPTIVKIIYSETEPDFVKKVLSEENKIERSKTITIYLKNKSNSDNKNYISELDQIAKIVILGTLYNEYENITLIEYEKDGVLFKGNKLNYPISYTFQELVYSEFEIHKEEILYYLRINKNTSINIYDNKVYSIKGYYKDPPEYIKNIVLPNLFFENKIDEEEILKIYNEKTYNIFEKTNSVHSIKNYYCFKNGVKKTPYYEILFNFLYKIILLWKMGNIK